jgi:hypothetical protein
MRAALTCSYSAESMHPPVFELAVSYMRHRVCSKRPELYHLKEKSVMAHTSVICEIMKGETWKRPKCSPRLRDETWSGNASWVCAFAWALHYFMGNDPPPKSMTGRSHNLHPFGMLCYSSDSCLNINDTLRLAHRLHFLFPYDSYKKQQLLRFCNTDGVFSVR